MGFCLSLPMHHLYADAPRQSRQDISLCYVRGVYVAGVGVGGLLPSCFLKHLVGELACWIPFGLIKYILMALSFHAGELHTTAAMAVAHSEEVAATAPPRRKPRGRKPRRRVTVRTSAIPKEPARTQGDSPGPSENGPPLPGKVPKKRGRKSKAELLLLKLSQGLDCQSPEPLSQQASLVSDEGLDYPETTPSGRPKRRAAKV